MDDRTRRHYSIAAKSGLLTMKFEERKNRWQLQKKLISDLWDLRPLGPEALGT